MTIGNLYTEEQKLISFIEDKVRNSKTLTFEGFDGEEYYDGDDFRLYFDLNTYKLGWFLKVKWGEKHIYEMNCKYDKYNKFSQSRFTWFNHLLQHVARKRIETEHPDYKKLFSPLMMTSNIAEITQNSLEQQMIQQILKARGK